MELLVLILGIILSLNPAQRSECSLLVSSTIFTPLQPSIELSFDLNTKAATYTTKSVEEATQGSLQGTWTSVVSTNELESEIKISPEHEFAPCKSNAKDTVFTPLQPSTVSSYELHETVATRATTSVEAATRATISVEAATRATRRVNGATREIFREATGRTLRGTTPDTLRAQLSPTVSTNEFRSKIETIPERGFAIGQSASETGDHVKKSSRRDDRGLVMVLGSLSNVRVKRDTEYEEFADSTNAGEFVQDDTPYLSGQEEPVVDESPSRSVSSYSLSDAQGDATNEEDSGSRSEVESADQLYPAGTGSSDDEMRDEWDTAEIPEDADQARGMSRSWSEWPLAKRRTWTSSQNHPKRNFIRVPVFPGK